jgi:COP9 signalosome complex subunit 6
MPKMSVPRSTNPLIGAHKSSDSGLQVLLHPLVLLTVSDYITRHTLREQEGPIVGALLGQQNGRDISLEHAFECKGIVKDGEVILHEAWLEERLQQRKPLLVAAGSLLLLASLKGHDVYYRFAG